MGACFGWCGLLLSACAPLAEVASHFGPVGELARLGAQSSAQADPSRFPAGFEYMQVRLEGRRSLMVLGQRAAAPAPEQGEDEHWYSPQSELLQLRDGRVWRALGMTTEWRGQYTPAPAWRDVPATGQAMAWQRRVDRMPGYRWADVDQVATRRLPAAPLTPSLAGAAKQWPGAEWFEDTVQSHDDQGRNWAYVQRFALQQGKVVYSEQCIAPNLCLTLVRVGPRP